MATEARPSPFGALNRSTWAGGGFVRNYVGRQLRPVEVLLMVWFKDELTGRVLELGCGPGRITGYLVALARELWAVDISPEMIDACRRRYPSVRFATGDAADLSAFDDDSFDAVVAGCNLIDVYSDEERRAALREIRRVLAPGGVLIMSSHNRAFVPRLHGPWHVRLAGLLKGDPYGAVQLVADVVRVPRRLRRHRRLHALEMSTADYAIVSDGAHDFRLVHYFTTSAAQERQFREEGLEPVLSADLEGRLLDSGYDAPDCSEIHYVARKPS